MLPILCFNIYLVGNWIQTRIDEVCWLDPFNRKKSRQTQHNNLGIWIGAVMAVVRKTLELNSSKTKIKNLKFKYGHNFNF